MDYAEYNQRREGYLQRIKLLRLISVSQGFLHDFDINASLYKPCRECMTQRMTAKTGEQQRALGAFGKLSIITVPDDPAQGFVQCSMMLTVPVAVDKDITKELKQREFDGLQEKMRRQQKERRKVNDDSGE